MLKIMTTKTQVHFLGLHVCFRYANHTIIDLIQGLEPAVMDNLGMPRRRDPDALPPDNAVERALNIVYHGIFSLGGGNMLFAMKAGLLTGRLCLNVPVEKYSPCVTVILCIPSFLKSTASFAYSMTPSPHWPSQLLTIFLWFRRQSFRLGNVSLWYYAFSTQTNLSGRFMGQLTIARFRGDTAFGLVARITSTFLGGLVGLVMW